jgi:glycosyltransferase involved in cell wall biosynthesis
LKIAGIKIGIDVRELQEGIMTGIGRYLLSFLKYATKFKPEWKFVLFGNQHTSVNFSSNNLSKILINEKVTFWWDQVILPLTLKKEKIDLFFSPYYKTTLISPCKVVITIHDLIPFQSNLPQESNNPLYINLRKGLNNLMAKRADLIIAVSNNSKKDIIRLFNLMEEKIKVVYNGIEERFYPIKDMAALRIIRKIYRIPKDYILYVGNLKPHKNVSGLIKAYNMLPPNLKSKFQLVIVGKQDKNFCGLFNLCKELRITDKVIFIDFVKDNDLPALYSSATVFVFSSFYEGFGLPVLEAMACGVPVTTSSVSSLPEIVDDAAILVNPYNLNEIAQAMRELLTDSSLREKLINKGLMQAKNFSWDRSVKGIINVMEGLL